MPNPWGPIEVQVQSGAIGWVTETQFEEYCRNKHVGGANYYIAEYVVPALNFAFNAIVTHPALRFGDNPIVTNWMQYAQMEQAIYLIQQGDARDKRLGLQAQNVSRADIVGEYFRPQSQIDLCAGAMMFLRPNFISNGGGWGKIRAIASESCK
jgi:hypothetical protein